MDETEFKKICSSIVPGCHFEENIPHICNTLLKACMNNGWSFAMFDRVTGTADCYCSLSPDKEYYKRLHENGSGWMEIDTGNSETFTMQLKEIAISKLSVRSARIKELESSQPKWVSVKDRMPKEDDEGTDFLVTNGILCVVCEWRGYWNNDPFCGNKACDEVTHWMPLPPPPTAEDSSDDGGEK